MIRLHLLGTLRLDAERAAALRSVAAQPRRAALLAYLALRAPRGPVRRDTLLGVFWPESDTNHARGALRSALHFLRGSLGRGVIRSCGSDEVQLDLDLVWCDVVEFERLCDAGDPAAALRVYGGDLLEGFFISEAPAFEQWLDGERTRLHQRAVEAARTLAAAAESAGEAGAAVLRLRRLLELTPTDEAATRQLMRLLAASGDRGEALRVFHDVQDRLHVEYGLDVADESRNLAESIRAADSGPPVTPPGRERGPLPARPTHAANAVNATHPANTVLGQGQPTAGVAGRRRRIVLPAAAMVVLLTAMLVVPLTLSRVATAPDTGSIDMVAVMPFEYRGAADHAYLAEGMADLLAANLNGAGDLHAVDPRALLPRVQALALPVDPASARRVASEQGARLYVLGSVTEAAGRLRISATLYGLAVREGAGATDVVVEGGADEILRLVDRVTLGLLQGRGPTSFVQAALRTTGSIEALKSFLRGEAALRRADVHEAIDHYRVATTIDSTFALAHYRLSSTAYRQGIARFPAASAAAALRHAGRLAREDSLLVAAWQNHVSGSASEAHRLYAEALVLRPGHLEASAQLGELLFHWGSSFGIPAAEAREPMSRVLAAEPANVDAALHLARLAARELRHVEVDSLAAIMQRTDPGGAWSVEMDALRAFLSADTAWQARSIAVAGQVPGRDRTIVEAMAAHSYNIGAVERLTRARMAIERTPDEQARMQLFLVHVLLARGQYHDALRSLMNAPALPAARRLENRAIIAVLPFLPISPVEVASITADVAAYPDVALYDKSGPYAGRGNEHPPILWPGMLRPRRLYLLGALYMRLGDTAAATAMADSLAQDPNEGMGLRYERLTRARVAAAAGQHTVAFRVLGPVQPPVFNTFETLVEPGRPFERWLRAELLRETGMHAEALRWYGTFPDPVARDLAYLAPSHLRRAEILDEAGDLAQAAFHYSRFVELWADADDELQPAVRNARQRLHDISALKRSAGIRESH